MDNSCTVTTQADCTGRWLGAGTTCTPNPCVAAPVGACCEGSSGHCYLLTAYDCAHASYNGIYLGDGTVCDPNPCPAPPPIKGACCLPGGRCKIYVPSACNSNAGHYLGPNTTCSPDPCESDKDGADLGACCLASGECVLAAPAGCAIQGGLNLGPNVDCDPNPCKVAPTEPTTWGRIKARYRD
jgi:hypothetical protein